MSNPIPTLEGNRMSISFIVATIGSPSLLATLRSIETWHGDESVLEAVTAFLHGPPAEGGECCVSQGAHATDATPQTTGEAGAGCASSSLPDRGPLGIDPTQAATRGVDRGASATVTTPVTDAGREVDAYDSQRERLRAFIADAAEFPWSPEELARGWKVVLDTLRDDVQISGGPVGGKEAASEPPSQGDPPPESPADLEAHPWKLENKMLQNVLDAVEAELEAAGYPAGGDLVTGIASLRADLYEARRQRDEAQAVQVAQLTEVRLVHCSRCGTRCSGVDPVLGYIVRAWVECPECLEQENKAARKLKAQIGLELEVLLEKVLTVAKGDLA